MVRAWHAVCFLFMVLVTTAVPSAAYAGGIVSLNFDDGYADGYTQIWRVEKAGFRATFYPHISEIGTPGHMTYQDLRTLAVTEHEVSLHSISHRDLTTIPLEQMRIEILGSRDAFIEQGLSPYSFAHPFGAYNQSVIDEIQRAGLLFARGTDYDLNTPLSNRWALNSHSITLETTWEEIKQNILHTKRESAWYIIVIHEIKAVPDPVRLYTITPAFLQQIINLLIHLRVPVVTNRQAVCAIYTVGCKTVIR